MPLEKIIEEEHDNEYYIKQLAKEVENCISEEYSQYSKDIMKYINNNSYMSYADFLKLKTLIKTWAFTSEGQEGIDYLLNNRVPKEYLFQINDAKEIVMLIKTNMHRFKISHYFGEIQFSIKDCKKIAEALDLIMDEDSKLDEVELLVNILNKARNNFLKFNGRDFFKKYKINDKKELDELIEDIVDIFGNDYEIFTSIINFPEINNLEIIFKELYNEVNNKDLSSVKKSIYKAVINEILSINELPPITKFTMDDKLHDMQRRKEFNYKTKSWKERKLNPSGELSWQKRVNNSIASELSEIYL